MPEPVAVATARPAAIEYRRMLGWGVRILAWRKGMFLLALLLAVAAAQLLPCAMKALEALTIVLNDASVAGPLAFFFRGDATREERVATAALIFAAVNIATILVRLGSDMTNAYLESSLKSRLLSALHDRVLTLGPHYHERHPAGEVLTIVTNYANYTVTVFRDMFSTPLVSATRLATSFYFILDSLTRTDVDPHWKMALGLLLLAMPAAGFLLARPLRRAYFLAQRKEFSLRNELANSLDKPVEVQLMNANRQRSAVYRERLADYFRSFVSAQYKSIVSGNFQSATALILQILFVFVAVHSHLGASDGKLAPHLGPSLLVFITLIPQVCEPLQALMVFYIGVQTSWPSVKPVLDLLETRPEVADRPTAKPLECGDAPRLSFEGVDFGYHSGPPVLAGLNYVFEPGRTTAIVGVSGAGKSSMLHLVSRMYDPWSGAVRLDGQDLRAVTLESLRRTVFSVAQFPLILDDTVRRNFQLVDPDVDDGAIRAICEKVGLWPILTFVAPGRELDFHVTRNDGLSGGELRRLALARGLLRRPKILLLDEPTSGLGAREILELAGTLETIRAQWPGTLMIVIDHNMNFIHRVADVVASLSERHIAESGAPADLLRLPRGQSVFRALWEDYNGARAGDQPHYRDKISCG